MITFSKTISATALALAALAPIAAQAEPVTVRVPYADLNLASETGRTVLDRRLVQAARDICGDTARERDLGRIMAIRKCHKEVVRSAEPARLALLARTSRAAS